MKKDKIKKIIIFIFRFILIAVGGYYCFMFIRPMFIFVNIGNILGLIMSIAVVLFGVFFNKIVALCKKICKSKKGKSIFGFVCSLLCVGIICFSLALGSVIVTGQSSDATGQGTIIVLGCAVKGNTPSFTLKTRVNVAYNYLESNPDSVAILSGGQGAGENISEAQCMKNMLLEKGISEDRLYLEDKSRNTTENIQLSKKVMEENDFDKHDVAIVTSDYHLKRAKMICEKNGIYPRTINAPSTYFEKPTFYLREALGVIKEFVVR